MLTLHAIDLWLRGYEHLPGLGQEILPGMILDADQCSESLRPVLA